MTQIEPGARPEAPATAGTEAITPSEPPAVIAGADAPPALRAVRGRYAGIASRVTANSIDLVLVAVLCIGGVWFSEAAWAILHLEPVSSVHISPDVTALIVPGVLFTYFPAGWALFGKTVGKAIMGLRVVRPDGRHVGIVRAELRMFIALMFVFIGYWWIMVDRRRRAWHDLVVRTVVVYDWDDEHLPQDMPPVAPHR